MDIANFIGISYFHYWETVHIEMDLNQLAALQQKFEPHARLMRNFSKLNSLMAAHENLMRISDTQKMLAGRAALLEIPVLKGLGYEIDSLKGIAAPLKAAVAYQADSLKAVVPLLKATTHHVDPLKEVFAAERIWRESLIRIHEGIRRTQEIPEILVLLCAESWFVDGDLELYEVGILGQKLRERDTNFVDEYFVEHYKTRTPEIFAILCDRHGERVQLFDEIARAADLKMYSLSIQGLLGQIDGICYDIVAEPFFIKNKKDGYRPRAFTKIRALAPDSTFDYLEFLITPPVISSQEKDMVSPDQLNRHAIMHGNNKGYGTHVNFYKCLSLLKYTSDVLMEVERQQAFLAKMVIEKA